MACLSCQRSLRTFVFPGVGGNCREQHRLFLQDVEMPRKLGNKQNFWRMNCDFVMLLGVNYIPLTSSDSKMWYTYLPLLTDYRTALETTFPELQKHFHKHFFQHKKGLDFDWLLTRCCSLGTIFKVSLESYLNVVLHPENQKNAHSHYMKIISGLT